MDDISNGLQLASSLIWAAPALMRLCFVLAIPTLYLVSPGVVMQGTRRLVDPRWLRGSKSVKIGWNRVKLALTRRDVLITRMHVSSVSDPKPARPLQR